MSLMAILFVLLWLLPRTCSEAPEQGVAATPATDSAKPLVSIDQVDATYKDGVITLRFDVNLTAPVSEPVLVDYQVDLQETAAHTAAEIPHGGRVVLSAGEMRKTVTLNYTAPADVALSLGVVAVHGAATPAGERNIRIAPTSIAPEKKSVTPSTRQALTAKAQPPVSVVVDAGGDDTLDMPAGISTETLVPAPVANDVPSNPSPQSRVRRLDINSAKEAPFIKLDASGAPLSAGTANAWSCVHDRTTGLSWEIKTDDGGLHDKDWTYTWFNSNSATNGGKAGRAGKGNCGTTVAAGCDTEKFIAAVNNEGLCGAKDWRLPNQEELQSLADLTRKNPAVDIGFLPNTPASWYWSSSPVASDSNYAWTIGFYHGQDVWGLKSSAFHVYLVRGPAADAVEQMPQP